MPDRTAQDIAREFRERHLLLVALAAKAGKENDLREACQLAETAFASAITAERTASDARVRAAVEAEREACAAIARRAADAENEMYAGSKKREFHGRAEVFKAARDMAHAIEQAIHLRAPSGRSALSGKESER